MHHPHIYIYVKKCIFCLSVVRTTNYDPGALECQCLFFPSGDLRIAKTLGHLCQMTGTDGHTHRTVQWETEQIQDISHDVTRRQRDRKTKSARTIRFESLFLLVKSGYLETDMHVWALQGEFENDHPKIRPATRGGRACSLRQQPVVAVEHFHPSKLSYGLGAGWGGSRCKG
jgi:hypothetical protein